LPPPTQFCAGGELFELLHKQPNKRFTEGHARFYTAEVLLALQYLHLLGFIYRDLKPENVLLQGTGHVLLTDFDLSFCASSRPHVLPSPGSGAARGPVMACPPAAPLGAYPQMLTCAIVPGRWPSPSRSPTRLSAPKNTFHLRRVMQAMLAPRPGYNGGPHAQVINASGHSSPVDWWELGIFLFELMYGFTPFRGAHREQTFENVLHRPLVFPEEPAISVAAQEITRALLTRDPTRRLCAIGGAEEVKMHPFFADVDFALIRWQTPPFVPNGRDSVSSVPACEDFIFAMDG